MTPKKNLAEPNPATIDKGEARRQQVLDAATECFCKEGIHGTSIARICQAAGMSPGHIYHYFENKEAIVEAIAERERNDLAGLLDSLEAFAAGTPLAERIVAQSGRMMEKLQDAAHVGLTLELAAEGARNPSVRAILQRSNEEIQASFMNRLKGLGLLAGMDEAELARRMELVISLKMGLAVRSVQNANLDVESLRTTLEEQIRYLLSAPGGAHR